MFFPSISGGAGVKEGVEEQTWTRPWRDWETIVKLGFVQIMMEKASQCARTTHRATRCSVEEMYSSAQSVILCVFMLAQPMSWALLTCKLNPLLTYITIFIPSTSVL